MAKVTQIIPKLLRLLSIAFFAFPSFICYSQSEDPTDTSAYFIDLNDYFNLSADLETDFEKFTLSGDDFLYDIRPNFSFYNKVGIDYRALSLFISFKPPLGQNNDDELKGKTTVNGFGFSFNTTRLINHLKWNTASGFYLENSSDFDPDFVKGESPYIQFPELNYTTYRGTHYYKFNPNFSYTAFNVQMAQQIKSAGSFATGISWNYSLIDNRIPTGQSSKNLQLLFDLAYYYTWILRGKWYLNAGLIAGAGLRSTALTTPQNGQEFESHYTTFNFRSKGILGLGYNSSKIFTGVDFRYLHEIQNQRNGTVHEEIDGYSFRVFFGFHILAPKFINRTYDKVEGFLGM